MAIQYFHVAVGLAGMVYVMSAVSALAAVKAPTTIYCADTESSPSGAPISLGVRDSLAGVLRDLSAPPKVRR